MGGIARRPRRFFRYGIISGNYLGAEVRLSSLIATQLFKPNVDRQPFISCKDGAEDEAREI
jgi:hypothetical protein